MKKATLISLLRTQLVVFTAIATIAPMAAVAEPTGQPTICVKLGDGREVVDKEVLATRLLAKYSISLTAIDPASLASIDASRPNAWILANISHICTKSMKCAKTDQLALYSIDGWLGSILSPNGVPGLTAPKSPPTPAGFFASGNDTDAVLCDPQVVAKNAVLADPSGTSTADATFETTVAKITDNIQVRGTPDQLGVQRGSEAAFSGAGPASISALRDGVAKTSTYKITGTIGYAVVNSQPGSSALGDKVIPYVGVNYSAVRAFTGVSKPDSSNTVDVGVYLGATPIGEKSALTLSVRPDYLWDYSDGSQLLTANARIIPYFKTSGRIGLNDYTHIGNIWFEPTLDFRLDTGRYTHDGSNAAALLSPTVVRLGGQVGLNLVSDYSIIPLSFNTSYTYLRALVGPRGIGWFSNTLTYSFGAQKNFGISLIYNNGLLEATAKRQEQSSIALTVKY